MAAKKSRAKPKSSVVYQFRIGLLEAEPEIWRRIVVPERYTFWDLHVAIQDAMGWLDYHLHQFTLGERTSAQIRVGIPVDEFGDDIEAGWEVGITDYFTRPGQTARYEYDFGDGWEHAVLLEGILLATPGRRYPICLAGERACPPEDCGGVPGLYEVNRVLADPRDEEHRDIAVWVQGQGRYRPYRPDDFSPGEVKFDNPTARWKRAFDRAR